MSNESENDINEFEAELMAEQNVEYTIEKTGKNESPEFAEFGEEFAETDRKLPKKDRLIETLEKMRPYCGDVLPTANKLKKTKLKDLEKLLARCISVSSGLNMKPEFNNSPKEEPENSEAPKVVPMLTSSRSGAETLYLANIGMVSVIEQISRQTKEYTGVEVVGWSEDIKKDKEQLVSILEAIYLENSELVKTYMSPTSVWALFMLSSGASHLKPARPA